MHLSLYLIEGIRNKESRWETLPRWGCPAASESIRIHCYRAYVRRNFSFRASLSLHHCRVDIARPRITARVSPLTLLLPCRNPLHLPAISRAGVSGWKNYSAPVLAMKSSCVARLRGTLSYGLSQPRRRPWPRSDGNGRGREEKLRRNRKFDSPRQRGGERRRWWRMSTVQLRTRVA